MKYDKGRMLLNDIELKKTENNLLTLFTTFRNLSLQDVNIALGTYSNSNSGKVLIHKFNKQWQGLIEIKFKKNKGYNLESIRPMVVIEKHKIKETEEEKMFNNYRDTLKEIITSELEEYLNTEQKARNKFIKNIRKVLK